MPEAARRRRRWPWLLSLALVGWGVLAGWLLLDAAGDLRIGRAAAESAREDIDPDGLAEGRPLPQLRRARDRFRAANATIENPVLAPLRLLPVVGRQVRSVDALSAAATQISDAAVEALVELSDVLAERRSGPDARLSDLRRLRASVRAAERRILALEDLGPRRRLIPPLAGAYNELLEELKGAQRTLAAAAAGSDAALRFFEGPSRYLVVAANNAEMRAGSGMWLSGGVLTTSGGRLELGDVEPLYEIADPPDGAVPIGDPDLAARWGALWRPNDDWRGLMVSPRLPASAELGARMWEAGGQDPIDGILVIDPVALAGMVRATGPVRVGERDVTADDIEPLLLHEQYRAFDADAWERRDERRDQLGSIASAVFDALDAGEWSPAVLARELARAVEGRHLLAWGRDPIDQRGWEAAGMAGTLGPDSLFVSVLNRGGNKLDWFLRTRATLRTRPLDDEVEVSLGLRIRNTVEPGGLPRYVVGPPPGQDWEPGEYLGVVTLNLPVGARAVRFGDGAEPVVRGPDGQTVLVAREVSLLPGDELDLTLSFRLPAGRSLRIEPSGRRPGIRWHFGARSWQDSRARVTKL